MFAQSGSHVVCLKMYNGVKQGGVISCHLFNLYIDPLLVQLSNYGYGCHIAGVYAGAFSYSSRGRVATRQA